MKLHRRLLETKTPTTTLYLDVPMMLCKWILHYSCDMLSVQDVIIDCLELYTKL
jgi:hypothetical protein